MSTVNIQINGKPITVEKGTHILAAAKQAGVKIPSLCAHPDLDAWAACGICVVKVSNARGISPKLVRACATECVEGENYITHDPELNKIRRTIIEMILADHPQSCLTCGRNGSCELQTLAAEFGIREIPFARNVKNMPKDDSTGAIVLDPSKCVQCGRCAQVCQQLQNVWALEFIGRGEKTRIAGAGDIVLNETPCIKCGQCSAHCPVGAIYELDETAKLLEAIRNPELTVIAQIAPAVRVAIGEEFDMEPGEVTTGKIYAALRAIGVDTVFDTNFGADLTIMEEGTEFVRRFTENKDGKVCLRHDSEFFHRQISAADAGRHYENLLCAKRRIGSEKNLLGFDYAVYGEKTGNQTQRRHVFQRMPGQRFGSHNERIGAVV